MKSHLAMSLNLFRTFLSLKTSFLIIFCKNNFWDKIDQKLEYDGGGAHVRNLRTCNVVDSFFHVHCFTSQKDPYFTFSSPFSEKFILLLFFPCTQGQQKPPPKRIRSEGAFVFLEFSSQRDGRGGMTHITRL